MKKCFFPQTAACCSGKPLDVCITLLVAAPEKPSPSADAVESAALETEQGTPLMETSVGARERAAAAGDEEAAAAASAAPPAPPPPLSPPPLPPRTTSETETELPADGPSTDHGSETLARTLPVPATTCADPGATPWACRTAE